MKSAMFASVCALLAATAAFAEGVPAAAPAGGLAVIGQFFPLIIFVVIFYFFILRPQKKRQKSHDNLVSSLQRGDKVITAGGFFGIVRDVKEDSVIIELAEGLVARVLKSSISTKISADAPKAEAPKVEEAAE